MDSNQFELIKVGATIKVHQKIKELNAKGEPKERVQVFGGMVIARHRKISPSATFTVRKIASGVGVEKIFPVHSPSLVKIEVLKQAEVRKSKLYYLRSYKKKLREKIIKTVKKA